MTPELTSSARFVSSTREGMTYAILQFFVLAVLFPFLWEPQLSFWIYNYAHGCGVKVPAKFISKIVALGGSILFIVVRVGYLLHAYDVDRSLSHDLVVKHNVNVVLACTAASLAICASFTRLLAPWLADLDKIDEARAEISKWDGLDTTDGVPAYRLCAKDIEPDDDRMSIVALETWAARILVLISLAIDVSSREGPIALAFGGVGAGLCFAVSLPVFWYTCCVARGKNVIPHQPIGPITSPEIQEAVDVSRRAHRGTIAIVWASGCALLFPVHLLRLGASY
jgi:hypothetical protein